MTVSGIIRDALYERAESAQPGLLVKGSSLILGPMQPAGDGIAHKCVALHVAGGGPRQVDYMRGLNTLLPAGEKRVPVYFDVRSDVGHASFLDGEALAWFVYDLLHGKPPVGFVDLYSITSAPRYVGLDEDQHHRWTFTLIGVLDA